MQNYGNWKDNNSSSAILEALNRGQNNVSNFGSVDQFLSGLLGASLNTNRPDTKKDEEIPQEETKFVRKENIPPVPDIEDIEDEDTEIEQEIEDDISGNDLSLYKIYKDKEEIFECNISVQGAKLSSSQVRLVFDHEICNLIFYGKISKEGKCVVALKKMNFYPEKSTGRVRLEVIVDDTIFTPWEETFIVEGAKKVTVQIKSQKKVHIDF
jgi:hypothetical protein